ncbi:SDR family oxidoreductase [Porticoccus sp. GXU_MW_L64]
MNLGITNKNALVLGGSQGLGAAIATRLAEEGARVTIVGRDSSKLEKTAHRIGFDCQYIEADLSSKGSPEKIMEAFQQFGATPDILINNCGGPQPSSASAVATEDIAAQIQPMLLSIIQLSQLALQPMIEKRWGRIITIASSGVISPIANLAVSNTLRSGLVSWHKTAANEVAPFGVTMNVVAPGRIDTSRVRFLDEKRAANAGQTPDEAKQTALQTIPAGRYGNVNEFAAPVAFLASELASYITGVTLRIDGGMVQVP